MVKTIPGRLTGSGISSQAFAKLHPIQTVECSLHGRLSALFWNSHCGLPYIEVYAEERAQTVQRRAPSRTCAIKTSEKKY